MLSSYEGWEPQLSQLGQVSFADEHLAWPGACGTIATITGRLNLNAIKAGTSVVTTRTSILC